MKTGLKISYAVAAAVLLFGIIGSVLVLKKPSGNMVRIVRDGEVLYAFDLSKTEAQTIRIDYEGSYNIIEIAEGRIRVKEAACPDNTCVKMGWLSGSTPIVCLPNRLVIEFSDKSSEVDAEAR